MMPVQSKKLGKYWEKATGNRFTMIKGSIKKYITDKTRAVLLNNPHNPTGVVYSAETIKAICDVLDCQPGDILEYVADEGEEE